MRTAIIALTKGGSELGLALLEKFSTFEEVKLFLPEKFYREILAKTTTHQQICSFDCPLGKLVAPLFPKFEGFVFIMAAGIVVRVIAPLIKDKRTDPAVVVMDEKGHFAVSLLSGHLGGANELAKKVAAFSGGQAVITTATDIQQTLAVDMLAKELGMAGEPIAHLKKINAALANGEKVAIFTEISLPEVKPAQNIAFLPLESAPVFSFAFPDEDGTDRPRDNFSFPEKPGGKPAAVIFVTNKVMDVSLLGDVPYVFLRPKNLVAGVGCKKGAKSEEILAALHFALASVRLAPASLKAVASISLKQKEEGLLEATRRLGVEMKFFSVEEIASCTGKFGESSYVKKAVGVGAVCEPAAWLGAGRPARLVVPKTIYNKVAVAIAEENSG